ncbi:hypothetical protein L838_0330 [Mycobacterium avium MAV_120709_2344]|nr:hypothetical protein L838_0330 [Mycobacterium avium MAV_120709_2344]
MTDFVKQHPGPRGLLRVEAAGLRWLSSVDGGVPCAGWWRSTRPA